jgi:hypothetical protein
MVRVGSSQVWLQVVGWPKGLSNGIQILPWHVEYVVVGAALASLLHRGLTRNDRKHNRAALLHCILLCCL